MCVNVYVYIHANVSLVGEGQRVTLGVGFLLLPYGLGI